MANETMVGQPTDGQMSPATGAVRSSLFIVGVGASAGGLEALEQLFGRTRPDTGMAFVVVQHLSPDFRSLMDEILSRRTSMPVRVATDGLLLEPNTIFLNPAGKQLAVLGGRLRVTDRESTPTPMHPIDHFLGTLAAEAGPRAAAVILSGTGADGAEGVRAIKRAGGLVIAQEPASAQFDGMPKAALATGSVDMTLIPGQVPEMLLTLVLRDNGSREGAQEGEGLELIIPLLRDAYNVDFAEYKIPTLARRTDRRMRTLGFSDLAEYAARLRADPEELDALYRDLLIGVTEFFRDPAAFEHLATTWLPEILKRLGPGEELRAWVAGCATGEEAYSLAIVIREALDAMGMSNPARIFATDIHRPSPRGAWCVRRQGPREALSSPPRALLRGEGRRAPGGAHHSPDGGLRPAQPASRRAVQPARSGHVSQSAHLPGALGAAPRAVHVPLCAEAPWHALSGPQ
jgi:two-component system CheB/CheR fusion protein